jgi:transposase
VIDLKEKHTIITLYNKGNSQRRIAKATGFSRNTVAKYLDDYQRDVARLNTLDNHRATQKSIIDEPKYDSSGRRPVKYTVEIDKALDEILENETLKLKALGITNKQKLTVIQIHSLLKDAGFDIGLTTVSMHLAEKRKAVREAFIRQEYELGDRLEYDFGEVRLIVAGVLTVCYLAAVCAPASRFKWAWLYTDQSKDSFLDSHVRLFDLVGGIWKECVYDNMRNVVSRFIGRNEKQLNPDLIKMSMYYGFEINVTNAFSGNEKGSVESAVKFIRNKVFALRYEFGSLDEAQGYLQERLISLNASSDIEAEKSHLLPARPPLEIARITESQVDKYSFIRILNNFYSVPDYLVGRRLTAKIYPAEVIVYAGQAEVARHVRLKGLKLYSVDIFHYLDTLAKKPGAVKNSLALKSQARLKAVFSDHFLDRPKDFVMLLKEFEGHPIDEIADLIESAAKCSLLFFTGSKDTIAENVEFNTRKQLALLTESFLKGGDRVAS